MGWRQCRYVIAKHCRLFFDIMTKPTIRVTQLEQFRRLICGDYPWLTEKSVIDSITGEFQGNALTTIGTAFHGIVQMGNTGAEIPPVEVKYGERGKIEVEPKPYGYSFPTVTGAIEYDVIFDRDQTDIALSYRDEFRDAFHEIREYKDYGDAIVTGCADMIHGNSIRDIKTKFSPVNCNDYINSAQWRYYLELFDLDDFYFDLFVFGGYKEDKHGTDVRGLRLERITPPIACYRYKDLQQDNRLLLTQFLQWAEKRNIIKYLYKNGKL